MNFSQALESLKLGSKIQREGWNGKGMYLTLVQGYPVNGHLNAGYCSDDEKELPNLSVPELNPDGSKNITQGKAGQMLSHIVMKTAGDSQFWGAGYSDYVPWLASQTDILAEDWNILLD
jgi:hypothetical protein